MDRRRQILIVEDEWIIAESLRDVLECAGYEVLGPVPNVAAALDNIDGQAPDVAVLDVTLRGESSFPIARALAAKAIPFLFLTGYVITDLPEDFKGRPILNKPVRDAKLLDTVHSLLHEQLPTA